MSILKMKKVTIGGLKSEQDDIMDLLQRMGAMEVTEVQRDAEEDAPDSVTNPELLRVTKLYNDTEDAMEKIKTFAVKPKGLAKPEYTLEQINEVGVQEDKLQGILSKIAETENEQGKLRTEIGNNEKTIEAVKPFQDLASPLNEIGQSSMTVSFIGGIPNRSAGLMRDWSQTCEFCYVEELSSDKDNTYYFLVAYNDVYDKVLSDIRTFGFSQMDLSSYEGTASQVAKKCRNNITELEKALEESKANYKSVGEDYHFLQISSDYWNMQLQRLSDQEKSDDTEYVFFVEGWVIANDVEKLRQKVSELSPNCFLTERDPLEDEFIPTALKNNKIVKNFEAVTDLYSPPDARGWDPNAIMSVFFFILFGMMLSDAGYGVLLFVGCIAYVKLLKPTDGMFTRIVKVMILGGISTVIWGSLFGSWFSFTPPEGMYWFIPMDNPLPMLGISYGLGIIHLLTGQILGGYMALREKDWIGAIFDNWGWVVLNIGLVMMAVGFMGGMIVPEVAGNPTMATIGQIGLYIWIGACIAMILTQGRAKKGIFSKFTSGLLSLYDMSGFISDVLSYSRLFALGLATGVVGLVANTIAGMILGGGPSLMWIITLPLAAAVFGLFHGLNIFINVLGAFVHCARLQYIEFYGKFYSDGGVRFAPLALKTKHVRLQ